MKITTKHVRNSLVTFVTHERSAVFFFLPSCCVNSLLLMKKWPWVLSRIFKFRRPSISHLTFKIFHIPHPVTILSLVCNPPNLCWNGVPPRRESLGMRFISTDDVTSSWQAIHAHAHALFWYNLLGEVSSEWLKTVSFVKLLCLTSSQASCYLLYKSYFFS